MGMIIQFTSGRRVEALLLAVAANVMRVVVSEGDTLELVRAGDEWYAESGEAVKIEGLIAIGGIDAKQFCSAVAPRTAAAAGSGLRF
jgi:hypothetical protein